MEKIFTQLEKELSIEGLPDGEKEMVLTTLGKNIMERILLDIGEHIDDADGALVNEMIDKQDLDGLFALIEGKYPSLLTTFDETVKGVVLDYKGQSE